MSLITSAISPHSPLLIPNIGKENLELLKRTSESYKKIRDDIYATQIETLVIISSHGGFEDEIFNVNLSPSFHINFEEFGDLSTKKEIEGDIVLAHQIKKESESDDEHIRIIDKPTLNHGIGIPAYLLTEEIKNLKVVPLYCSEADLEKHWQWGVRIKEAILNSNKRIAVIASADLSHKLTKNSPAGYSPKAVNSDQKIINFIQNKKIPELTKMKPEFFEETATEGIKSISVLGGIMNKMEYKPKLLSYEYPFGAGYVVMKMDL